MIRFLFAASLLSLTPLTGAFGQDASAADYAPRTVLAKPMPAITEAKNVRASEARITGNELVIGVEVGGQSRAYPINQLTGPRREIINDVLGGIAIAATW